MTADERENGGELRGRVALVTGAGTGPGRRFATVLARAGAAVVLGARRLDLLRQVESEIRAFGGAAMAVALDLCDPASIVTAVEAAERRFGTVDILVNNAATSEKAWAVDVPLAVIDRVIDTNFRGPFLLCTEVARRLMARKMPGRIVNISSVGMCMYLPSPPLALYSATKAAVKRMTETLAIEWAPHHINVNAILPGLFRSEQADAHIAAVGEERIRNALRRKRFGEPAFLDSTLLYLVSPASHAVTGASIIVDDGQANR